MRSQSFLSAMETKEEAKGMNRRKRAAAANRKKTAAARAAEAAAYVAADAVATEVGLKAEEERELVRELVLELKAEAAEQLSVASEEGVVLSVAEMVDLRALRLALTEAQTNLDEFCELQHKHQLCLGSSIENAEMMENCP